MHDRAERVDRLALQQDVDLDQVGLLIAARLVVERGIAGGLRLQLVEEVEHDLAERDRVLDLDAILAQVVHAEQGAAARLAQLHDCPDVVLRRQDRGLNHRLRDAVDLRPGRKLARVGDRELLAILRRHLVGDARGRRDQIEAELALQALGDDLEMEQAQESAAEAEPERDRGLRLVVERGIRELQLVERLAQHWVVAAVDRIQPREDHRLRVGVAGQRLGRGRARVRHRVTDLGLAHVLHTRDQVADLADAEALGGRRLGRGDADLEQFVHRAGRHHLDLLARLERAVDHPDVGDDPAVGVVDGVEDHGARRRGRVAHRGRDPLDDAVEQLLHALAGLAAHPQHVLRLAADETRELFRVLVRVGGRQVDLVQHRDDLEVVVEREIQVREGLGLDALRGIDEQNRPLAGREGAAHLVGEVDVPGGVDHVQGEGVAADLPRHPHGLALDRDAALTLDVHAIQVLGARVTVGDDAGDAEHPVGERRLSVVDVRDDAEIPDARGIGRGRFERLQGTGRHFRLFSQTAADRTVMPRRRAALRRARRARPGRRTTHRSTIAGLARDLVT